MPSVLGAGEEKRKQRGGKDIMQMGYYATQNQGYYSRTARADYRVRYAKRAAKKRQRHLEEVKMLAEGVFLLAVGMSIGGVVIFVLGCVIAVLG